MPDSFNPVRSFVAAFTVLGCVVVMASACAESAPPPAVAGAPFVVLVTIDTLRADATTPYGAPTGATPSLAAFAHQSIQFDRAFTVMPTTGPAHLAILTGRYPQQVGALQNGVAARPGTPSLATVMRASGRRTAAFVSVHHLSHETLGLDGFDVWDAPDRVRDGAKTVAAAAAWIADQHGAPFFLWLHLFDPHQPYKVHADAPRDLADALAALADVEVPKQGGFAVAGVTPAQQRKLALLYAADVHHADRQLGTFLAALDHAGITDRAAIVVTADHGEVLGEALGAYHYGFDHGEFLLPMEMRVPLWVRVPEGGRGVREARTVETRAVFGTLAAAAGLAPAGAPVLPGTAVPSESGSGDTAAFSVRRSFQAKDLPDVLRGTRHAMATEGTLLVSIERDGATRSEPWICGDEHPTGLVPARLSPAAVERQSASLEAWIAAMAEGTGPAAGPDDATRERLRALGYLD